MLKIKAVRQDDDVTVLAVYDGDRYVSRLARIDHPDDNWDLLAEVATKIPAAILDAMVEEPVK